MKTEYFVIAGAVALALVIIFYRAKVVEYLRTEETKAEIKKYILVAEKYITGEKKGQERLELVCARLRDYLPQPLRTFVTTKAMVDAVNFVFEQIAVKMEDGTTKAIN